MTSACAGLVDQAPAFLCVNNGSSAKQIPASRVRDTVCDCCDGSDEAPEACVNTCLEEGLAERLAAEDSLRAAVRGRVALARLQTALEETRVARAAALVAATARREAAEAESAEADRVRTAWEACEARHATHEWWDAQPGAGVVRAALDAMAGNGPALEAPSVCAPAGEPAGVGVVVGSGGGGNVDGSSTESSAANAHADATSDECPSLPTAAPQTLREGLRVAGFALLPVRLGLAAAGLVARGVGLLAAVAEDAAAAAGWRDVRVAAPAVAAAGRACAAVDVSATVLRAAFARSGAWWALAVAWHEPMAVLRDAAPWLVGGEAGSDGGAAGGSAAGGGQETDAGGVETSGVGSDSADAGAGTAIADGASSGAEGGGTDGVSTDDASDGVEGAGADAAAAAAGVATGGGEGDGAADHEATASDPPGDGVEAEAEAGAGAAAAGPPRMTVSQRLAAAQQAAADASSAAAAAREAVAALEREASEEAAAGALAPVAGECAKRRIGTYEYEVCLLGEAKQDWTSLGSFDAAASSPPRWLRYAGGASCWNGPARSVNVSVSCGPETELLSVDEPSTCAYVARVRTPGACSDAEVSAARARYVGLFAGLFGSTEAAEDVAETIIEAEAEAVANGEGDSEEEGGAEAGAEETVETEAGAGTESIPEAAASDSHTEDAAVGPGVGAGGRRDGSE